MRVCSFRSDRSLKFPLLCFTACSVFRLFSPCINLLSATTRDTKDLGEPPPPIQSAEAHDLMKRLDRVKVPLFLPPSTHSPLLDASRVARLLKMPVIYPTHRGTPGRQQMQLSDFYNRFALEQDGRLSFCRHPDFTFQLNGWSAAVALAEDIPKPEPKEGEGSTEGAADREKGEDKYRKVCRMLLTRMIDPTKSVSAQPRFYRQSRTNHLACILGRCR